jgi:hypothetical protein
MLVEALLATAREELEWEKQGPLACPVRPPSCTIGRRSRTASSNGRTPPWGGNEGLGLPPQSREPSANPEVLVAKASEPSLTSARKPVEFQGRGSGGHSDREGLKEESWMCSPL